MADASAEQPDHPGQISCKLPMVSPTVEAASSACITRLRALGHRLICVLVPDRVALPIDSFTSAAKAKRLKMVRHEYSEQDFVARVVLEELMSKRPHPTAVVALQAEATKLLEAAAALRIKIPVDLSTIAVRDRSVLPSTFPADFSTIHIDPRPMGQRAADVLKAWLVDGVSLNKDRLVEVGSWIERSTTGAAPHSQ